MYEHALCAGDSFLKHIGAESGATVILKGYGSGMQETYGTVSMAVPSVGYQLYWFSGTLKHAALVTDAHK